MPLPIWPFQWETSNQVETEKTTRTALMKPLLLIKGWFQQINIPFFKISFVNKLLNKGVFFLTEPCNYDGQERNENEPVWK